LVLMPVDEWSGNICENITPSSLLGSPLQWRRYVDVDSVSYPKATLADYVKHSQTHAIETAYTPYAVGPVELAANTEQRIWFFFAQAYGGTTLPRRSKPGMAVSIRVYRAQRYLGMRGQQ
jgi:hypothetical protein